MNTLSNFESQQQFAGMDRLRPGDRQTAPARLGMWDDENDDRILKVLD